GIEEIGCEQSDTLFVVACIEYMPNGFQRPQGWFAGAHVIEHEDLSFQHRLKHAHFGGLAHRVIAILNFLEQLAIIVEKTAVPAQCNLLQSRNSQMRFAYA